ncbi:class I SAM-dependent methyltransferase [Histidinibacterium lentulum]|nr:class I SAM-dependent methyltransferase [Histidinibacterium lentulum]
MSDAMTPEEIAALYDRIAPDWASARSQALTERRWLDRFRAHMPVTGRVQRVLDLGCGAGRPMARYLAERGASVTGVDAAPAMVALFAENMPGHAAVKGDMRSLDLGETFEGLLAWDSLFHLGPDDQRAAVRTMAAHAAPGAALMLTTGHRAGEAWGEVAGEPVWHASLDPGEYRTLLTEAGFDVLAFVPEDESCGGHTVWLARRRRPADLPPEG